jgi:universal stress protein E
MNILVATDFSPRAQRAVRRAGILATRSRSKLILMHVVPGLGTREVARDLREAQRMTIEQIAVVPELFRLPCEPLVTSGNPSEAILDAAIEWEVDLIVAGAPRGLLGRGSGQTVRTLVRESPCPVLVVRQVAERSYTRVLAAVDLSDASARALRSAASLKLVDDADVTIVHAFEAPGGAKLSGAGIPRCQVESYVEHWRSSSAEEVEAFLATGNLAKPDWRRRVEEGATRDVIVRVAEDMCSDLLVVGTHARKGIRRALLGSVTEDVLSTGGTDVLVVPPPRPGSGRPTWLPTGAERPRDGQHGARMAAL